MTMGEMIRQLRKERGLTQEQLAEVMGVSIPAISKWETGQSAPELGAVVALADFFSVSVDCLVGHQVRRKGLDEMLEELEALQQSGDFHSARDMAERILRSYPNHYEAVDACANVYYAIFIHTQEEDAIFRSLELVQRLFPLVDQNPKANEYELRWRLANHYELMDDYASAMQYYEKGNLSGSQNRNIARCLVREGRSAEGLKLLSKEILAGVYRTFHDVSLLIEIHQTNNQPEKAVAATQWGIDLVRGLPAENTLFTAKLLTFLYMDLFALWKNMGKMDQARQALRHAMEQAAFWDGWTEDGPMAFLDHEDAPQIINSASSGISFIRTVLAAFGYQSEEALL